MEYPTITLNIATGLCTDENGPGTAVWRSYTNVPGTSSDWLEFVSGQPCTECVNAEFAKDRHSLCESLIN